MVQRIEMSWKEKYEMYNLLKKGTLIGMLIECNKVLQRLTPRIEIDSKCFYTPGLDTSGRCINCRKYEWEH
jgi:hypothetical protein